MKHCAQPGSLHRELFVEHEDDDMMDTVTKECEERDETEKDVDVAS